MRACPSFPGYSASEDGRVFTHRKGRRVHGRHGGKEPFIDPTYARELLGVRMPKGYVVVGIRVGSVRSRPVGIHQLVADAFIGLRPDGQQVRHLDGNPGNNAASNLAYGTVQDNANDRKRHGHYATGSRHPSAKLSALQVAELVRLREAGLKVRALADSFGVSVSTVESVLYGKAYRDDVIRFKRLEGVR